MTEPNWNNPWKLTAIGMALVMVTALVTGLVVANWSGQESAAKKEADAAAPRSVARLARPAPRGVASAPIVPTQSAVDACNQYAAAQVGPRDKTLEVVKDVAIGAAVGAAVGAAGGAIAGGGKGAGKGAAIGGIAGAGGGTLYGLAENRKHDERYREVYASCMRSRGYAS